MVSLSQRLLLFSCFVVRQVLLASSGNCPLSINCGYLQQISFPFTTPQHPNCGMLIIHGCDDPEPESPKTIQNNQRWFDILEIKLFKITIRDPQLHDLLLKQSCDILNFHSMFTVRMPLVSSRLQNHLTVFGCNINYTMDLQLYYSVSNSTSICRNQNNTLNGVSDLNNTAIVVLPDSIPSNSSLLNRCKKVELPTPSEIDFTHFDLDDLFYFLTADIAIELQVSQSCSTCHDIDGGQCRLDNKGQFYCHHGISIKTRLIVAAVASSTGLLGVLAWFLRRHFISNKNPPYQIIELFLKNHGHLSAKRYTYTEIKKATNSFKNKLGQGGYGSVYKGKLQDGSLVAV